MNPKFEIIHMAPEFTNSVLISESGRLPHEAAQQRSAVIIDPWGRAEDWDKLLRTRGLNLCAVYCTHGHPDHISAAPELGVPWFVNRRDHDLIQMDKFSDLLDYSGLPRVTDISKLRDLAPGKTEILPGLNMTIIASPGHSGGGLVFYFPTEKTLLFGDTLFQDCVGRYDLPGASHAELKKSIAEIYNMNLPDNTLVIHGHGPETTIAWLKENNRFFK